MMTLLKMSLSAALLICAVLLLRTFAGNRLPRRCFTALWTVVLLRLLLPFYVEIPSEDIPAAGGETAVFTEFSGKFSEKADSGAEGAEPPLFPMTAVYLIGVCGAGTYFLIPHIRSRVGCIGCSLPLENSFAAEKIRAFRLKRRVRISVSDRISSPCTCGIFRPMILFPKSFDFTNKTQLNYVLTHELVHIRRLDVLFKYLTAAAVCLHWFNPFVWAMYAVSDRDIELACDEEVLRLTGGERSEYALTLIALAEKRSAGLTVSGFGRNAVKERINAVMRFKDKSFFCTVIAAALVAGASAVFVSADVNASESVENTSVSDNEEKPFLTYSFNENGVFCEGEEDGAEFTCPVGNTDFTVEPFGSGHKGIDLFWDGCGGADVLASSGGTVCEVDTSGWGGGYGSYIVIDHGNGISTRYAHLSEVNVSVGEHVVMGQVIGKIGSTGDTTGETLHFELLKDDVCSDPMEYLASPFVNKEDVRYKETVPDEMSDDFEQYEQFGIVYNRENGVITYNGRTVKYFEDSEQSGEGLSAVSVMTNPAGEVGIIIHRDADGNTGSIEVTSD